MRNFKRAIWGAAILAAIILTNAILIFLLQPYDGFRADLHNLETKKYDDIFVGTSHGKCAIDPLTVDSVTGRKSLNLCLGGEYTQDAYYLIKEAARVNKPKRVIYELDPSYWFIDPYLGMDYTIIYDKFPASPIKLQYFFSKMMSVDFRSTLFPWYVYRQGFKTMGSNVEMKLSEAYKNYDMTVLNSAAQEYRPEGFIYRLRNDMPKDDSSLRRFDEDQIRDNAFDYFEKMVEYCNQEAIELVVIITPVPKEGEEKYAKETQNAYEYFDALMKEYGVTFRNFNVGELEGFDRSLDNFVDFEGHMYGDQAEVFSTLLGNYLNESGK